MYLSIASSVSLQNVALVYTQSTCTVYKAIIVRFYCFPVVIPPYSQLDTEIAALKIQMIQIKN